MKGNYFMYCTFSIGIIVGSLVGVLEMQRIIIIAIGFGLLIGTILRKIKQLSEEIEKK